MIEFDVEIGRELQRVAGVGVGGGREQPPQPSAGRAFLRVLPPQSRVVEQPLPPVEQGRLTLSRRCCPSVDCPIGRGW